MTITVARALSSTFTSARVRDVMLEVGADFTGLVAPRLITFETANSWAEDLSFVLEREAARGFQVQFTCPGYAAKALDYRVSADGTLQERNTSGGIDYFGLPAGTRASLFVDLDYSATRISEVLAHLRARGWGFEGQAVAGNANRDRVYSKDGYGVVRSKVGGWS